jgi:hypothetical protein
MSDDRTERLDSLTRRLEEAAERLRSGDLDNDAAAALVEECARLAAEAGTELDRLGRDEPRPGQDRLL